MAKTLNEDLLAGSGKKYDWDKWLDGKTRELVQGKDFDATRESLRQAAYQAGKKRGVRVVCHFVGDNKVHLQAQPVD